MIHISMGFFLDQKSRIHSLYISIYFPDRSRRRRLGFAVDAPRRQNRDVQEDQRSGREVFNTFTLCGQICASGHDQG